MSLTDTINPNAASSNFLASSRQVSGSAKMELPEKDLFHKYILDKESKASSGDTTSFQDKALDHDSELHSQQGVLTSNAAARHSQQALQSKSTETSNVDQSFSKEAKEISSGSKKDWQSEQSAEWVQSNQTQPKESVLKTRIEHSKSQIPQNTPQPIPAGIPTPASPVLQPLPGDKADIPQYTKNTTSNLKQRLAREGNQAVQNHTGKAADSTQSDVHPSKLSDKGENSGTQSENSGNSSQQQNLQKENPSHLNELIPQQNTATQENFSVQQAAIAAANVPQQGTPSAYSGPVAQLAQQIFRMQETGGTSRVTLDMPDGQKLLVRFNVSPNHGGIKVRFSTQSPELREAIERSWGNLRVEANSRGVDLEAPEFDPIDEVTPHPISILNKQEIPTLK